MARKVASESIPPPTETSKVAQPPAPAPKADYSKQTFSHIADYAIACNRFAIRSRGPGDRIFQVGGRTRLLRASAGTVRSLNDALQRSDDDKVWSKRLCSALADLGVVVADSVFRKRGAHTAARLLLFLVGKLEVPLEKPRQDVEDSLTDCLRQLDRDKVADLLNTVFAFG